GQSLAPPAFGGAVVPRLAPAHGRPLRRAASDAPRPEGRGARGRAASLRPIWVAARLPGRPRNERRGASPRPDPDGPGGAPGHPPGSLPRRRAADEAGHVRAEDSLHAVLDDPFRRRMRRARDWGDDSDQGPARWAVRARGAREP